jgi:hypothetical protein
MVAALSAVVFSGMGCQDGEDVEVVLAEQNDMGIVEFEIHRTTTSAGDPRIDVVALDGRGDEVGRAKLLVTNVNYTGVGTIVGGEAQPAKAGEGSPGSLVTLTYGDKKMSFVTPDRVRYTKRIPDSELAAFAKLSAIESTIEEAVGMTFGYKTAAELAYSHHNPGWGASSWCTSGTFGSTEKAINGCAEQYPSTSSSGYQWHVNLDTTKGYFNIATRGIGYSACRQSDMKGIMCGTGNPCFWGPCTGGDASTVENLNWASQTGRFTYRFTPSGGSAITGVDSNGTTGGGTLEHPYAYGSGAGSWYAGYSASVGCSYSKGCALNKGTPNP